MKKYLLVALAAVAFSPLCSQAQIITNDPLNLAQNLAQVQQLVQQLQQLKDQLEVSKNQLANMSGAAGYGGMVNDGTRVLKQNLPEDWSEVYTDSMNKNSALSGASSSMSNKFNAEVDTLGTDEALEMTRNRQNQKAYYDRVMAENAYNNQMKELNDIQTLTNQIDSTTTTKEIQDLQARIQAQQGAVQGEQAKLTLMATLQESQDKILAGQRERAVQRKAIGQGQADQMPDLMGY